METLKIYVSTHKVFKPIYDNPLYEIVAQPQVNIEDMKRTTNLIVHHMTEDHLFYKMPKGFSDVANIHWVWKHMPKTKYIGFAQYGCELKVANPIDINWVKNILNNHTVICSEIDFGNETIKQHYDYCHFHEDFDEITDIINDLYPWESKIFKEYYNHNILNQGDMFIIKYEYFDKMMQFVEEIMSEFVKRHNFKTDDDISNEIYSRKTAKNNNYQTRVLVYLSERLIGYFLWKMPNKYIVPMNDFETSSY